MSKQEKELQEEQIVNKKLIIMIIVTVLLLPFVIMTYVNNLNKIEETLAENPYYEESIDNIEKEADKHEEIIKISNSYCDNITISTEPKLEKYIYYNTVQDNCAMITQENSKLIGEYTTKAYKKATSLKEKWEETFPDVANEEGNKHFTYGKQTIKNKNGNIIGFVVTLTYNNSFIGKTYALNPNTDEWELIKTNKY